jgi:regulator of protease activity HflC (stomatin/prohibitin superfamily)
MNPEPTSSQTPSCEKIITPPSGWRYLIIALGLFFFAGPLLMLAAFAVRVVLHWNLIPLVVIGGLLSAVLAVVLCGGFFTLQPNEAAVLVLFGEYRGTVRSSGFFWVNPFTKRIRVSLRARNLNGERLKVNDKLGNPIEIAAVVVWRVEETTQAVFDVDNYETFVRIQSESAVRHLANGYAYDNAPDEELTLRSGADEIAGALCTELRERVRKAGVHIEEARLSHLAYAPEIAQAMLRRQQAEAIIAARQKIVHGAVGMVDDALRELSKREIVHLDDERKAAMVSNLLVVLCGESEVHPVVNTGTLYT